MFTSLIHRKMFFYVTFHEDVPHFFPQASSSDFLHDDMDELVFIE